jgi:hypothetical protein
MNVVYKAPGQKPEIIDIPNTLEALQEKVGGPIETVSFATDACVVCNEEGRILELPYNAHFCGVSFVGPILFVGINGEEFTGLSENAARLIMLSIGGGKYAQL